MGRSHLSVMGVIYEALGFATAKFGTVLRVSLLPLLLLLLLNFVLAQLGYIPPSSVLALRIDLDPGWINSFVQGLNLWGQSIVTGNPLPLTDQQLQVYLGLGLIGIILQSSFMVPLISYAGTGEKPHHGMVHLGFGPRHLGYVIAAAISFPLIMVLMNYALYFFTQWVTTDITPILQSRQIVFEEGSLHAIHGQVESFQGLKATIAAVDNWLSGLVGRQISSVNILTVTPFLILGFYAVLRLLAWPYLAAAGQGGVRQALRQSAGFNVLSLAMIMVLFWGLNLVAMYIVVVGCSLVFGFLFAGTNLIIEGYQGVAPDTNTGVWLSTITMLVFGGVIVALQAFMAGLQAGLGGALVHRA